MNHKLMEYIQRPELYAPSTANFWNDEHISKSMLEAHLNPELDAASRKEEFIDRSVAWICGLAPSDSFPRLLDLGCGPGLYTTRFHRQGYQVTGIDFSKRSIEYAKSTDIKQEIRYHYKNYLTIDYQQEFDVITLIYRDFSVLSEVDRKQLLHKISRALKPGGKFIVDVTLPNQYKGVEETKSWSYQESGFWCREPHLCISAFYRYDDSNTFLNQYVLVTEEEIHNYNIWDHAFTNDELERDLAEAGYLTIDWFGDAAGADYLEDGSCMCAVAQK